MPSSIGVCLVKDVFLFSAASSVLCALFKVVAVVVVVVVVVLVPVIGAVKDENSTNLGPSPPFLLCVSYVFLFLSAFLLICP